MAWNFSTQLIPLGSSSECTKHEKASRNSGPQGPCAIPPRHGQSQLISPVTGLKAPPEAPCADASSSAGCSEVGEDSEEGSEFGEDSEGGSDFGVDGGMVAWEVSEDG
jgi:hypothetical protein